MNALNALLSVNLVERLGWTLVHSVWELTAIAGIFALAKNFWRPWTANRRYLVASLAMMLMVVSPVLTYFLIPERAIPVAFDLTAETSPRPAMSVVETMPVTSPSVLPNVIVEANVVTTAVVPAGRTVPSNDAHEARIAETWSERMTSAVQPTLPWLVWVWGFGVLLLSIWHFGGLFAILRLKRRATLPVDSRLGDLVNRLAHRLCVTRPVKLLESSLVQVPSVVGWLRPVILMPVGVITGMPIDQLKAVLAHELAHIRRHDYLVNLLQTIGETLFFYHPAIWWISRRVRQEREFCADETAVAVCGNRIAFAKALTALEECCGRLPNLAVAATGGSLKRRIRRILEPSNANGSHRESWLGGTLASLFLVGVMVFLSSVPSPAIVATMAAEQQSKRDDATVTKQRGNSTTLDKDNRSQIPPYELKVAGAGDPQKAPKGLVAILGDSRLKHWYRTKVLGFGPKGKIVVSDSMDRIVKFWDVATGREQKRLDNLRGGVALSPDRKTLFLGNPDGRVQLIDVLTGKVQRTLNGPGRRDGVFSISRNGKYLATRTYAQKGDRDIEVWDIATGKQLQTFPSKGRRFGSMALSPDGRTLAASQAERIMLWDVATGRPLPTRAAHRDLDTGEGAYVYALCFSPDGHILASGGADMMLRLWDVGIDIEIEKGRFKHSGTVWSIAFSPKGTFLASASSGGVVLWNWQKAAEVWSIGRRASSVAFSPDGKILAAATKNRVLLLDATTRFELDLPAPNGVHQLVSIAVSPSGRQFATGSTNGLITLYDLVTGHKQRSWQGHTSGFVVRRLAYSPDGKTLASVGDDRNVVLWNPATGVERLRVGGGVLSLNALAFSPDSKTLASRRQGRTIDLWDAGSGALRTSLKKKRAGVRGQMAFSPDGGTLFAASSFHTVTVWDVPTRTVNQTLGGSTVHDDVPLALSPNGRYVAAGSWGNRFNVWDLEAEREVELLAGHRGLLLSLAFSPDGKTLASSAQDGKVQFWDPHSGKLKKTLTIGPAGGEIRQLAFGPNGQYLVTANGNGTVYVLRLGK